MSSRLPWRLREGLGKCRSMDGCWFTCQEGAHSTSPSNCSASAHEPTDQGSLIRRRTLNEPASREVGCVMSPAFGSREQSQDHLEVGRNQVSAAQRAIALAVMTPSFTVIL